MFLKEQFNIGNMDQDWEDRATDEYRTIFCWGFLIAKSCPVIFVVTFSRLFWFLNL